MVLQVIHQKTKKSFEEITADLCPSLTMQQLYRISTMYWDDKYNTQSVAPEVISTMRARINEAAAATGHSTNFLLDDDSRYAVHGMMPQALISLLLGRP